MPERQPKLTGHEPTPAQIVIFNAACLQLKDPLNGEQWGKFAKAAGEMQRSGWTDAQIINGLWTVRPDIRPANMTPEEKVAEIAEAEAQDQQRRRMISLNPYPLGHLTGELEFHASIIQSSMMFGEQIVVKDIPPHPSVHDLPSHVLPADPLNPFYLSPGELFRAQIPDKK